VRAFIKRLLGPAGRAWVRRGRGRLLTFGEKVVWGGRPRERVLLRLLGGYYESLYRRQWVWSPGPPHFEDHRIEVFRIAFGRLPVGPQLLYRGVFSSEVIQEGDRLLEIGCGDGFFTTRFFASRCSRIDAIDIEPDAIRMATKVNGSPNVRFFLQDAVRQPFPGSNYDVVVWDGALGHFRADETRELLGKVYGALGQGGVFVGSESLGHEGEDHLQFFESTEDLAALFKQYWKHVQLRSVSYHIGQGGFLRTEAYWRCGRDRQRLDSATWKSF
jgi:SAM-dependent methyltransferase